MVLCPLYLTDHLNAGLVHKKQYGEHLSCIQMVGLSGNQMTFKYRTIWDPASFRPFEYSMAALKGLTHFFLLA